jgi:sugar O-acyltransferase (sialic acid O-acetyltransferase NeuD family)
METEGRQMNLVILGAGGFAREVFYHFKQSEQYHDAKIFFVDDISPHKTLKLKGEEYPVIKDWDFSSIPDAIFYVAIGNPVHKRIMVDKALAAGIKPAPAFVHRTAEVYDAKLGVGTVVCKNCIITDNVKIGDYVIVSFNVSVGHDAEVGDYTTINPSCQISGYCQVGSDCVIGTGTAIRDRVKVGDGVLTGVGSAVVKDLDSRGVYVGVPARKLEK